MMSITNPIFPTVLFNVLVSCRTSVQVSELTDACEVLTLDKEQLALEQEELQVSRRCCRITSILAIYRSLLVSQWLTSVVDLGV